MKDEKRNQDRWWQCPSINHLRTQSLLCPVMRGCCQDQKNIIKPNFLNLQMDDVPAPAFHFAGLFKNIHHDKRCHFPCTF